MTLDATLVCVHAHPDDEALFTAGISSHYRALGYQVVLVTCTNGRLGLDQRGRPGSHEGHDGDATVATRAAELQRAAIHAGFTRLVSLGYEDSGMIGWPQNEEPNAFMNADVEAVATTLAALFDEVGAHVVVTYDENGFYGHPDHIMANRVTQRAVRLSASAQRLYYPVVPRGVLEKFTREARDQGVFLPAWIIDATPDTPDELVACVMDVTDYAQRKQEAIALHQSQIDNGDLVTMAPDLFALLFGTEYYQRAWSRHAVEGDRADLFGGM
ncbi:MAG: PIG-L family deacetylase [Acidimicrobiales bacterium]